MSSSSNGGTNGSSATQTRSQDMRNEHAASHHEGIVKVIEVLAESTHSWEDAARKALAQAQTSLSHIKSIYVKDMQAIVEHDQIVRWRLNAKISFAVVNHQHASRSTEGGRGNRYSETNSQGGSAMERMEEGRRQFRDDRDENRDRYESQDEGRYRGQSMSRGYEDEGRRASSQGYEQQGETGAQHNIGWRYGGEGRYGQDRYNDDSRYQGGGYQSSQRDSYRQDDYGRNDYRGGQSSYYRGDQGSSSRFGGQETGGQFIGRQYRGEQLGNAPYGNRPYGGGQYSGGQYSGGQYSGGQYSQGRGQYGGGQYSQGGAQYEGGQYGQGSGMYGAGQVGQFGGQMGGYGNRQHIGGGHYDQGGQYGIERQGYFGEGGPRQGYGRERDEGFGRQMQEFGGAMAGRVRRMFKGPKGYKRSDDRIREDVCDMLAHMDEIEPSDIEVTVSNGEVTLSGSVPERAMKWQAEQVVDNVSGVNEINNQLRVKRSDNTNISAGSQSTTSMGSSTKNPTARS